MNIRVDVQRGCGWREDHGALYLVADGLSAPCGKLPIPLARVCECCGQLIYNVQVDGKILKQSRSHRNLLNPAPLLNEQACAYEQWGTNLKVHKRCPLASWPENKPAVLDWIGKEHYATTSDFTREAVEHGVSRRIRGLPEWFEIGKDWVFLAHPQAVALPDNQEYNLTHPDEDPLPEWLPGIFHAFRPQRVEVIVDDKTTPEEMESYKARGYTPTRIIRQDSADRLLCGRCHTNVASHNLDPLDWDEYHFPLCEDCWVWVD